MAGASRPCTSSMRAVLWLETCRAAQAAARTDVAAHAGASASAYSRAARRMWQRGACWAWRWPRLRRLLLARLRAAQPAIAAVPRRSSGGLAARAPPLSRHLRAL